MDSDLKQAEIERQNQIRSVLSTLKSLADATDGASPRSTAERVAAKSIIHGVRSLNALSEKEASTPDGAIALAVRAEKSAGDRFVGFDPISFREMGFNSHEIDRIMAARLVIHATEPFTEWHVFLAVATALNNLTPDWDEPMDLSVAELAWAADAMRYMDPVTPFSDEVASFVAMALHEEGFVVTPEPLKFAQECLMSRASNEGVALSLRLANHGDDLACRIQLERLLAVANYVNNNHKKLISELAKA